MLEMIQAAGLLIWVLAALSLYVVFIWVLRHQQLHRLEGEPHQALLRTRTRLRAEGFTAAIQEVQGMEQPYAHVLKAGLHSAPYGKDAATSAMNASILSMDAQLYAGIAQLGTVAQIAPLIGLLGTVIGMVRSFVVFSAISNPSASQLAGGISEALINTAAGLIVAILGYVGRNTLRAKADRIALRADQVRELLPAWLAETEDEVYFKEGSQA